MKKNYFLALAVLGASNILNSQEILPNGFTEEEKLQWEDYVPAQTRGETAPPSEPVRNMAEWEELQAITITWTGYTETLVEIVRAAVEETTVIINCASAATVSNTLTNAGISLDNVEFIEQDYNSIWIRDYGPNVVYLNDVGEMVLVDWVYNRPRPFDDAIPQGIADHIGVTMYETTTGSNELVHTGGNFMSDGLGTGFSSELVYNENETLNESQVLGIMNDFMGIDRYVVMDVLPYDGIHHIDMHMKLLDEETLLVGEYPDGVADGPQIEANIQYVLSNFNSVYGTPYKVIRIPMPPDNNGQYPNGTWQGGDYYTYANATFINKTVIVPVYYNDYDDEALQIWQDALPGYNIVGIDCRDVIQSSGALHCITHEIGVSDPLWIVHNDLEDTDNTVDDYTVEATIKHNSGIANAYMYYKTDLNDSYTEVVMTLVDAQNDTWSADIPAQVAGTNVYYYVKGVANSGKEQVRPMPAPEGYWEFEVYDINASVEETVNAFDKVYPNPANSLTVIPLSLTESSFGKIEIYSAHGQLVDVLYSGELSAGFRNYFFDASKYETGAYYIKVSSNDWTSTQVLMIK